METLGERIRKYRALLGLRQQDVADRLGESSGRVIYNWEKDLAKPECTKIPKLCEILQVSADELLGCSTMKDKPTASEWGSIKKMRALDERGRKIVNTVIDTEYEHVIAAQRARKARLLKLDYFSIPVSAGDGSFLEDGVSEPIYVPESPEAEAADFVVKVCGNSMEPSYFDGDKILVCKQHSIKIGEVGIFVVDGDVYVKELGNGELISHNPSYAPISLHTKNSVYCLGKVLGVVEN